MRAFVAILGCAGVSAVAAPGAWAAPTRVLYDGDPQAGSRILVAAAPGEANDLAVSVRPEAFLSVRLMDQAAGIRADSLFCAQVSAVEVACDGRGLVALSVRAGDLADRFTCLACADEEDFPFHLTADTGPGPDEVVTQFTPAGLDWSPPGEVKLSSGGGDDRIRLGFRPGDLDMSTQGQIVADAGDGDDLVLLEFEPAEIDMVTNGQIRIGLGPGADTAQAAGAYPGIELGIAGETGADNITLAGPGMARGGPGADTLLGGAGDQRLFGDEDDDHVSGGDGDGDLCHGGTGTNTIAPDCEKSVAG